MDSLHAVMLGFDTYFLQMQTKIDLHRFVWKYIFFGQKCKYEFYQWFVQLYIYHYIYINGFLLFVVCCVTFHFYLSWKIYQFMTMVCDYYSLMIMTLYPTTPRGLLNTLRPRQNGRHFAEDIFKCIFLNENVWISIKISLKCVPKGPINNIPALVQMMACRRQGDKPLSEPIIVSLPTRICVTRSQWVNSLWNCSQATSKERHRWHWFRQWLGAV